MLTPTFSKPSSNNTATENGDLLIFREIKSVTSYHQKQKLWSQLSAEQKKKYQDFITKEEAETENSIGKKFKLFGM